MRSGSMQPSLRDLIPFPSAEVVVSPEFEQLDSTGSTREKTADFACQVCSVYADSACQSSATGVGVPGRDDVNEGPDRSKFEFSVPNSRHDQNIPFQPSQIASSYINKMPPIHIDPIAPLMEVL